MINNYN